MYVFSGLAAREEFFQHPLLSTFFKAMIQKWERGGLGRKVGGACLASTGIKFGSLLAVSWPL
jgi:hypothetical protein